MDQQMRLTILCRTVPGREPIRLGAGRVSGPAIVCCGSVCTTFNKKESRSSKTMKRFLPSFLHQPTLICPFLPGPQITMPFLSKTLTSAREEPWMSNLWTIYHPASSLTHQSPLFSLTTSMVRLVLQNQDLQIGYRPASLPGHLHNHPRLLPATFVLCAPLPSAPLQFCFLFLLVPAVLLWYLSSWMPTCESPAISKYNSTINVQSGLPPPLATRSLH